MPDRYDEIEHELLGVPLKGGVAVAPPVAPAPVGAPVWDRYAEIEHELGLGLGSVAPGGQGGVEVASPDLVRGAGPRALRDTGPDVVPAVTDL